MDETRVKRGKTNASKSRFGFSFASDWLKKNRVRFFNQSQTVVKQNQSKRKLLSSLDKKPLYLHHVSIADF